ncbi:MAG TPA: hypothetical protein VN578_16645 [Candidatus Binatia bacterium]|jgi:hypothetical protein|nr:hypothetical protein [Candidatus Binatia bacterium]
MRPTLAWLILLWLALPLPAEAATGRVLKVLPQFLDLKGRNSLSPSLYERDAYQAVLRAHPERRSAMRFNVQWKTKGPVWDPLKVRVEMRGIVEGNLPKQLILEEPAQPGGWFSHWTGLTLTSQQYKTLGEVTAWRVTLWEGEQLLGEQKSFLW